MLRRCRSSQRRWWLKISPPILPVESFYLLLGYTDVPMLQQFRSPEEVGIMFVAAIRLVVRAAIGPVERLLNTVGRRNVCAPAYALSFALNPAPCLTLIPRFGGHGAAASTALTLETVLLFWIVRRRLGLHALAFGRRQG